ncbi:MAG: AMP-binding protein, partial [Desulfobacterales bacterium]|nr:AMP-binding protein [Desulfobacterales bacterium]
MHTIKDIIDLGAEKYPDKTYLIAPEPGRHLSYQQLKTDSENFGRHLVRLGLKKGDKISFMLTNSYQTTKIFLGAMYAGFVVAPLNLMAQPAQLEYVIEHSDTRLIFCSGNYSDELSKTVRSINREIMLVEIDPDAKTVFQDDDRISDYSLPEIKTDDEALLLYTSGTTGKPKGVILSHKNMLTGGDNTIKAHRLTPEDRALCSLPLYHINGEVVTAIAPLVSGGSVVMPHKFSSSDFWELMSVYSCTWFSVVPTIISYLCCMDGADLKNLNLDQVRFGRSASSALPPSLHEEFENKFHIPIVETMGLTETAAPVFSNPLDPAARKFGSPGVAVGNEAKIVDGEGNKLPSGSPGEIMIRGNNVMKCYYKNPEATAEVLKGGWLHTGDLGRLDEYGYLYIVGRLKDMIIR